MNEEKTIRRILNDSFGCALKKDRALFESIFSNTDEFFTFYSDPYSTRARWLEPVFIVLGPMDGSKKQDKRIRYQRPTRHDIKFW